MPRASLVSSEVLPEIKLVLLRTGFLITSVTGLMFGKIALSLSNASSVNLGGVSSEAAGLICLMLVRIASICAFWNCALIAPVSVMVCSILSKFRRSARSPTLTWPGLWDCLLSHSLLP
ncbi:hypothetical protein D3C87_1863990 [compost metagenome]